MRSYTFDLTRWNETSRSGHRREAWVPHGCSCQRPISEPFLHPVLAMRREATVWVGAHSRRGPGEPEGGQGDGLVRRGGRNDHRLMHTSAEGGAMVGHSNQPAASQQAHRDDPADCGANESHLPKRMKNICRVNKSVMFHLFVARPST